MDPPSLPPFSWHFARMLITLTNKKKLFFVTQKMVWQILELSTTRILTLCYFFPCIHYKWSYCYFDFSTNFHYNMLSFRKIRFWNWLKSWAYFLKTNERKHIKCIYLFKFSCLNIWAIYMLKIIFTMSHKTIFFTKNVTKFYYSNKKSQHHLTI